MSDTTQRRQVTIDGNSAAAHVAYACSEVIAIYPITPSSPMGEESDAMAAKDKPNLWGTIPNVTEMQSEGGAAGAVHGALTTGALTTTFTASQGLLLMIPNMFKIAGELTPTVFHVSARALAAQGLSIFGDHSDVMSARSTGWCQLCSGNVQEVMDLALVAHAATLESRLPFLHFFDGFRTSHEVAKVEELTYDDMRALVSDDLVTAHQRRGLTPDRPSIRGTAQNPDVYFQGRETVNKYYDAAPGIVQSCMDRLAEQTGRSYKLFDYVGAPDAERVVIMMGSGAETMHETVEHLVAQGEKVGLIKVRLFRPFAGEVLVEAIPETARRIAVLDRTKEPGANGEPLYQDVQATLMEALADGRLAQDRLPVVVGGRYGLGSKEFDPGMAKSVLDNLNADRPKNRFTVGIIDDVTGSNLPWKKDFDSEGDDVHRALFFGLGADGTVGANKNSIKIIGSATDYAAQGYFVYDSKKSGSMTVSHLRFSPRPIRSTYLIDRADFVACHAFPFLERFPMVDKLKPGGVFLLNSPLAADETWNGLPRSVQDQLIEKGAKLYVIDAYGLARELGLGGRINIIMQTAFFLISGVIPEDRALTMIEDAVKKTYGSKGPKIVEMNVRAARGAKERLHQVALPATATSQIGMRPPVPAQVPDFVRDVTAVLVAGKGDELPVSKMPEDGTWPVGTTRYEKRGIGLEVPEWDPDSCIQCNLCAFVCPHATIRAKLYDKAGANGSSPEGWRSAKARGKGLDHLAFTIQVAPEDCTGCAACVHVCPAHQKDANGAKTERKAINMVPVGSVLEREKVNWDYFLSLAGARPDSINPWTPKGSQLREPLFEFSGACNGCGETPYVKLMTQLFGDRMLIANATGCSSIYGGNLPTTPFCTDEHGRGPAWSNSLFEDNAEFGLGFRLNADVQATAARQMLAKLDLGEDRALADEILANDATVMTEEQIAAQRARLQMLSTRLAHRPEAAIKHLLPRMEYLIPRSVWVLGGDGWAYDIGYGGVDHVLASGRNINLMVLDTGVYSNTGGQSSKATPRAAVAKFAASGKDQPKKDLGAIAMTYGNIYVAQIAYAANPAQTVKALREAEAYDGPSLIIAYSHCIAHGIDMATGTDTQKDAVNSGFWPLFRFDPSLAASGRNPFQLDSREPSLDPADFAKKQGRFRILVQSQPERAELLLDAMRKDCESRWKYFQHLATD